MADGEPASKLAKEKGWSLSSVRKVYDRVRARGTAQTRYKNTKAEKLSAEQKGKLGKWLEAVPKVSVSVVKNKVKEEFGIDYS